MNKYTELSDFEINLKVAHIMLGKDNYDWCPDKKEVYLAGIDGGDFLPHGYFDPCGSPSDAMPIIIENEISMIKSSSGWMCCHGSVGQVEHESLYRGAMELFLMMKDAENENNNNG
ncbi:phage protein NinX family protein [Proteus genomosp. 6]|uniref:phage protein NinX family protein n=1 Tax=Proteus genomosp. 6 TaxID=1311820 RepID=UPI0032DB38C4